MSAVAYRVPWPWPNLVRATSSHEGRYVAILVGAATPLSQKGGRIEFFLEGRCEADARSRHLFGALHASSSEMLLLHFCGKAGRGTLRRMC